MKVLMILLFIAMTIYVFKLAAKTNEKVKLLYDENLNSNTLKQRRKKTAKQYWLKLIIGFSVFILIEAVLMYISARL